MTSERTSDLASFFCGIFFPSFLPLAAQIPFPDRLDAERSRGNWLHHPRAARSREGDAVIERVRQITVDELKVLAKESPVSQAALFFLV